MSGARRAERGLTLVEIVLAILILGLMVSLTIPTLENVTRARLRSSAAQLIGAIRFTYAESAMTHTFFRLTFDLDGGRYWPEKGSDASAGLRLKREKQAVTGGIVEEVDEAKEKEEEEKDAADGSAGTSLERVGFSTFSSMIVREVKLDPKVHIDGVWASHLEDRVTSGKASVYFFPNGQVEPAIIHLADDAGSFLTIEVEPASGRSKIHDGYRKWEDLVEQ